MGRDSLGKMFGHFFEFINFYDGQFYDAEYDMWFTSETYPLSPDYKDDKKLDKCQ